ncbi:MAG: hypothetical protein Q7T94_04225 [Rugosibacter sp.]|nr:hypothetical protein [Rugosibacter sp.]
MTFGLKLSSLLCGNAGSLRRRLLFGGKPCSHFSGEPSFFESSLMLSLKLRYEACSIFNEQLPFFRGKQSTFACPVAWCRVPLAEKLLEAL